MERQFGLNPFALFVAALMLALVGLSSLAISQFEITVGVLIALGLVVGFIVFLKTELAVYILIFSMLLSPELVMGGLATTRAALGRGVTFRFDDFLLVIIALTWFIRSALNKELGIFKKTPLNSAMLAYILACSVSTLIGMAAGNVQIVTGTLFLLKYTQYFAIFFLVINNIDSEDKLRRYWWAVLITALVVGTLGLSQIPGGGRVTAPFEGDNPEPNTFGGYLAFLILICFAMSLSFKDLKWRIIYGLMAFYLFIPFLFTLSLASYLGLIPGVVVVLFLQRNRLLSYVLLASVLSLLLFPSIFPQAVRERVSFTWTQAERYGQSTLFGQRLDTSTSARLQSFGEAFQDFSVRPVFGYGVTGWRFIDSQYFRTLVETGLVGLTALLFLFFRLFRLGMDRFRDLSGDPFYRGIATGFLGGFVCLLVHGIGSNTFILVRVMEPFWLIAGIVFMAPFVIPGGPRRDSPDQLPATT